MQEPPRKPAVAAFEERLRELRNDRRNVALPVLAAVYLGVLGLFGIAWLYTPWWIGLALMVPMGLLQYRIVISGHEAVHGTLCWPRWLNEALGVFGQALVGVNFASYRVQHLEHHRARTTDTDPDGHIYGPIIRAPRGLPRVVVWTLGTFIEIAIKIVQKGIGSVGTRKKPREQVKTRKKSGHHTLAVLGAQLTLFLGLWVVTGRITGYAELWILPLFLVTVFLNRTRIMVEHGLARLYDVEARRGLPTVDISPPAWQRLVFAPFWFNHHGAHHLFMAVPHYNLPALVELCREHRPSGWTEFEGSYLLAIREIMKAQPVPSEPRAPQV